MFKKSMSVLLAVLLFLSIVSVSAVAQAEEFDVIFLNPPFSDVDLYWATSAIEWASEKGIVEGFPDGTFKPFQNVTEAEFAAILARYAKNTDKDRINQKEEGKHWAQPIYDELIKWQLPFGGYTNDKIKDSAITRGQVARIVAAKNGFNLDERQAIYYMYENDLSSGMIPGRLTFESYDKDKPLQRDQVAQFIKLLNDKGITTFMGKPSEKGDAGANEIIGIADVPKDTTVITDEMFDELAEDKGIKNPPKSENADELWESLDKSGGITSESQLTPEIIQKIKDLGPMASRFPEGTPVGGWTAIDQDLFEKYKASIEDYLFNKTKQVDAKTVVVCKDLHWETKPGQSTNRQYFRVIVNGREAWYATVGFTGTEYKVLDVGRDAFDIFN